MKLYTKRGDGGQTSLVSGRRVSKADLRVEAYGSVDELSAFVALLGDSMAERGVCGFVADFSQINRTLMSVEAIIAADGDLRVKPLDEENISWIEGRIDELQSQVRPLTRFTIPGGNSVVSMCHVCRTIARRVERAMVRVAEKEDMDKAVMAFINRLSDYFYVLGRLLTEQLGVEKILWEP